MIAHREVVAVVLEVHYGHRQPMLVAFTREQAHAIAKLRQILADQPHAGEMIIILNDAGVVSTPGARNGVGRDPGKTKTRQRLHLITTGKAARRIMPRFILDDPGHLGTAVEIYQPWHDRIDGATHVTHVIAPDLARGVGKPIWEH